MYRVVELKDGLYNGVVAYDIVDLDLAFRVAKDWENHNPEYHYEVEEDYDEEVEDEDWDDELEDEPDSLVSVGMSEKDFL